MKVFINPGHDTTYDSGAVNPNTGLRECDVAAEVGARVAAYLEGADASVKSCRVTISRRHRQDVASI